MEHFELIIKRTIMAPDYAYIESVKHFRFRYESNMRVRHLHLFFGYARRTVEKLLERKEMEIGVSSTCWMFVEKVFSTN